MSLREVPCSFLALGSAGGLCARLFGKESSCAETGSYLTPPFQGQVVRGRLGGKNAAVVILTRAPCIHGPDTC